MSSENDLPSDEASQTIGKKLSAYRLADSSDTLFSLSENELANMRVFAANVSALPKTEKELQKQLKGPATVLGKRAGQIIELNKDLAAWTAQWRAERVPMIEGFASDVALYSDRVEACYANLSKFVRKMKTGKPGESSRGTGDLIDRFEKDLWQLREYARKFVDKVKKATDGSVKRIDELQRLASQYQKLSTEIQNTLSNQPELEALNAELSKLEAEIHKLNAKSVAMRDRVQEKNPFTLIPFVQLVTTAQTLEMEKTLIVKAFKLEKRHQELANKKGEFVYVSAGVAVLQRAKACIATVEGNFDSIQETLEHVQGIWQAIASDLDDVLQTLSRMCKEGDLPELDKMEVDAAALEWKAVGDRARAFSASVGDATELALADDEATLQTAFA